MKKANPEFTKIMIPAQVRPAQDRHLSSCGSKGTVVFIEEQYDDDESESWIAEYEAGLAGSAMCVKCKTRLSMADVPY
jgi:hypothetical protein